MHTRAAAQLFFFFIRHKEGDGGFWKLGGKFFRQHLTRGLPVTPTCSCRPPPICFAQPSGNEE